MGIKRRYLFTNEPIPRRSRYRRRKKEENESQNRGSDVGTLEAGGSKSDSLASLPSNYSRSSFPAELNLHCNDHTSDVLNDSSEDHNNASLSSSTEELSCGEQDFFYSMHGSDGVEEEEEGRNSRTLSHDQDTTNTELSSPLQSGRFDEPPASDHPIIGECKVLLSNTLCSCTPTTEGDVLLMCLSYGVRHNLSWVGMVDMLKMINQIFCYEAVDASKYFLHKYLEPDKACSTFHIYCPKCEEYLGTRKDINPKEQLSCGCGETIRNFDKGTSYFLSVDLKGQLKQLLELPNIAHEIMTYRFQRSKNKENALEDIYDGAIYKKHSSPGSILSDPLNFSYKLNTDGVSLGDSTPNSVWPIYAFINELPPNLRWKHMVFAGIWVGKKDPNMRLFLKPFVEEANRLSTEGVQWEDDNGVEQVSKVIPLCAVVDSVARYKVLNMSSFHAYAGCTFCYHTASNTHVGRRYLISDAVVPLRSHDSILQDMAEALENINNKDKKKRIVRGQKGPSPLVKMLHFDIGDGFVVDFMHSVLLGNVKSHINKLLNDYGKPYYIGSPDAEHLINQRLLSIKPPKSITRPPRSLTYV